MAGFTLLLFYLLRNLTFAQLLKVKTFSAEVRFGQRSEVMTEDK